MPSRDRRLTSSFESLLAVSADELDFDLRLAGWAPHTDFWLNPRRLRGSDFLMRWSQGVWSEKRVIQAVSDTGRYVALPYGPSSTAPDDPRAFELYFERLDRASTAGQKRPDLLLFDAASSRRVEETVRELGGVGELPFTREDDPRAQLLISRAILAVECENSLWRARQMPDYGTPLRPQRRLRGNPGLRASAVAPTVIIKEEDRAPLGSWQAAHGVPIHIWHVFYDVAFGLALDSAEALIGGGIVAGTDQVYHAPGGATTRKTIYKILYRHAYLLGEATSEPSLVAECLQDKNGHILPYVRFEGGRLALAAEALGILEAAAAQRRRT